jgi:hypothetical protein
MSKEALDIRVGLSTTKGSFLSWLIRKFTRGKYSHSWISYPSDLWGGYWMAHSDEKGVRKIPAVPYLSNEKIRYAQWRCKFDLGPALKKCRNYVGKKYDFKALLIGFPLKFLVYWLSGKTIMNPTQDKSKMTCSEFVAIILQAVTFTKEQSEDFGVNHTGSLPDVDQWNAESITPKELDDYFCKYPELFQMLE